MVFESSGFEEAADAVVDEVAESEDGASKVFETTVDGFGWPVRTMGMVEVGQDVPGAAFQRAA